MTRYGFIGLSGQFYPVADDPITANAWLEQKQITADLVAVDDTVRDDYPALF